MIDSSGPTAPVDTSLMVFVCGMSRSGTTLLATVLDSHSRISMGYELIPIPFRAGPAGLIALMERGLAISEGRFEDCPRALDAIGEKEAGVFFKRCRRAGLDSDQTREALADVRRSGVKSIESLRERLTVAWRLIRRRHDRQKTALFGFKLNIPSYEACYQLFPGGYFIYILRDPRDVVASHFANSFDRTVEEISNAWNNYLSGFEALSTRQPGKTLLIRYEDLVNSPRPTLEALFRLLPVEWEESVLHFDQADAAVYQAGHPNAGQLRQGFFTDSINRWINELNHDDIRTISELCGPALPAHDYEA